jgi:hypothetical protein
MVKEPGLDDRHRDKDGEISRKHGNTLVRTLRKIYGQSFASGFAETDELSDVLQKDLAHFSLTQLRRDHAAGTLEGKIKQYS